MTLLGHSRSLAAVATVLAALVAPPLASAEDVPASLSDVRVTDDAVTGTLVLRGEAAGAVDPASVTATVGGERASATVQPPTLQPRSTMLVIDTSNSMGASGMATVRSATAEFLKDVPDDVKVGVVSFASTSGWTSNRRRTIQRSAAPSPA